jgi:hypothetical protein
VVVQPLGADGVLVIGTDTLRGLSRLDQVRRCRRQPVADTTIWLVLLQQLCNTRRVRSAAVQSDLAEQRTEGSATRSLHARLCVRKQALLLLLLRTSGQHDSSCS